MKRWNAILLIKGGTRHQLDVDMINYMFLIASTAEETYYLRILRENLLILKVLVCAVILPVFVLVDHVVLKLSIYYSHV